MKKQRSRNVAIIATLVTLATLAILAMSSITVFASTNEDVIKGDLNADHNVNCFDMILMKRAISGTYETDLEKADINNDGKVTVADAAIMKRFFIGAIPSLEITTGTTTTTTTTANNTTKSDTSTTTTNQTTITTATTEETTTTEYEWIPPKREDLVHNGETMDEETYQLLINTAKMFGVKRYEFQWSSLPIEYGYFDPGPLFCMTEGYAYGYGVQVLSSDKIYDFAPEKSKLEKSTFKYGYEFLLYRPILEDDNDPKVLSSFELTTDAFKSNDSLLISGMRKIIENTNYEPGEEGYEREIETCNAQNPVEFMGWYLVPVDENGEKVEEVPKEFDTSIKPAKSIRYWFTNEQLCSAGFNILLPVFNIYIETAYLYDMPNFKIVYNNDKENPILYSFEKGGTVTDNGIIVGAPQVLPYYDLPKVVDLYKFCLEYAQGSEKAATQLEEIILEGKFTPFYYVTLKDNDRNNPIQNVVYIPDIDVDFHKLYVMIPLDEEGNEDLRPYPLRTDIEID